MPFEERIVLRGTENVHRPGLEAAGPVKMDETVRVSVILERESHAGGAKEAALGSETAEAFAVSARRQSVSTCPL